MQFVVVAPRMVLLGVVAVLVAITASERKPFQTSKLVVEAVPPTPEEQSAADAHNAKQAAVSAKAAAGVATAVAAHSVDVSQHAQSALKNARDALHLARANTQALSKNQEEALHKAEGKLTVASGFEKLEADARAVQKAKLEYKLSEKTVGQSELAQMGEVLKELREDLAAKRRAGEADSSDAAVEEELEELEEMLKKLEAEEAQKKSSGGTVSHDELKAQIERLREIISKQHVDEKYETEHQVVYNEVSEPTKQPKFSYKVQPVSSSSAVEEVAEPAQDDAQEVAHVPAASGGVTGGIDIDTAMPYGELEPFGREDTAQELTESSIHESDEMVDQLERAEVAEEKRAVFRALTRLRGAAITSFDGVARSQTGNIDEYNKVHQWRSTHPLHHLADEESDISKWAFPDNADF